jgi:uncharacterized protein (DUF2062 family)
LSAPDAPEPDEADPLAAPDRRTIFDRFERLLRYRFLIPLKRAPHPPEWAARGTMIGMFWGLTPTIGVQVVGVFVTWILARRLFRWDFSFLIGTFWTGITNVLTAIPIYYSFFVVGQIMLGHWDGLPGYSDFRAQWHVAVSPDLDLIDQTIAATKLIFGDWGLTIMLGSLPFSIFGGWLGYHLTYRFVVRYRRARAERIARRGLRKFGA